MMETGTHRTPGVPPRGTAVFDMALGVLLALTETDPLTAKTELIVAARQGRVDVFHLAAALVGLACGQQAGVEARAIDIALVWWGQHLAQLPGRDEHPRRSSSSAERTT